MKADLKFKAVWWNSFLFYWALIFLLFALVAAAADFFNLGRLMLWAALGAFAGAKAVNLALGCGACWLLADLVLKHSGL